MEEIVVKKTIYITDDGKRFDNLESAQEHEKHLEALEKLNSFKIDGPRFTPFDAYNCSAYNWQWYKIHDQAELQQLLRLAAKVYAMGNYSDDDDFNNVESRFYDNLSVTYDWSYRDGEQKRKFPKYIAISFERECINTLDNIEKQHEIEMDKWKRFYRYFENELKKDIESDDHYRGAQEEC